MPSKVRVGNRVSGTVGPLIGNSTTGQDGRRVQRKRERLNGVVLGSAAHGKWHVLWDNSTQVEEVHAIRLRDEGPSNITPAELRQLQLRHIGSLSSRLETAETATTSREEQQNLATYPAQQVEGRTATAINNNENESENAQPNAEDGSIIAEEEEQDIDPDALPFEDDQIDNQNEYNAHTMDDDDAAQHNTRVDAYKVEKEGLMGSEISVGRGREQIVWKVRSDVDSNEVDGDDVLADFDQIGVKGFNFAGTDPNTNRLNLLLLIVALWPGKWREQLGRMNREIKSNNESQRNKRTRDGKKLTVIHTITEKEFWHFWGLILAGRVLGRKGNLWDRTKPEGIREKIDYSWLMKEYRFNQIKKYIPFMWARPELKDKDPWWQYSLAIEEFNENRSKTVLSSRELTPDEIMSALRPRTTKTGNLPNLSHIDRKPEDLGTEYKVVADCFTEMLKYLEIQKGMYPMREAQYAPQFGVQTACTMRLAQNARRPDDPDSARKQIFYGDSWFTSVKAAIQLHSKYNMHLAGVVKKSHARYPLKFLETKMENWPSGSYLVLEGHASENVDLIAVGHKYSSKKVISFLFTKGAGRTVTTASYEATWKDLKGNTRSRLIPRPEIIGRYFSRSNMVDKHNQARQAELKLEKHWVTEDGYFRNITTLFGVGVTDAWKAYRFHLNRSHRHKEIGIVDFANLLAQDCLQNNYSTWREEDTVLVIQGSDNEEGEDGEDEGTKISSLTGSGLTSARMQQQQIAKLEIDSTHIAVRTTRKEKNEKKDGKSSLRTKRRKCRICKTTKTPYVCKACGEDFWICEDETKGCLTKHRTKILQSKMDTSD